VIDVSELMRDPDFAAPYTVLRKTGKWEAGRFVEKEEAIPFYGPVQPPSPEELEQVPEADRRQGALDFLSDKPIHLTREAGNSDEIMYRGERYKVVQVKDWLTFNRATGVRL
jgi:hypothetical protein